ncbi:MAG: CsgG/HfaB family protein [Treponema sp.]|jgi:hypothetical protein|nr:CsgG/HfaB family protein [Treponema sp.]
MKHLKIKAGFLAIAAALIPLACATGGKPGAAETESAPVSGNPAAGEPAGGESPWTASLTEALYQSYEELSENIQGPVSIAVIAISSPDPAEEEFALEELTLFLVNSKKYRVVDRRDLDIIRAEQNFHLSGEVDDDTAVSIGHLIGAAIVITGRIISYDIAQYLSLKALDVETGRIRAMSSRRFPRE